MLFREGRFCIRTAVLVVLFSLCLNVGVHAAHRMILQQGIAREVLRFHILADSDTKEDQELKYRVRDAVIAWLSENETGNSETEKNKTEKLQTYNKIKNTEGKEESGTAEDEKERTERFLASHLTELEAVANAVLEESGAAYRAHAEIVSCYFPERTYGAYTFPAGWYEALRMRLGEAKGQNWWCVLFPRLCFADCLHGVMEDGEVRKLEEALTVEEYEALLKKPEKWKLSFRWF